MRAFLVLALPLSLLTACTTPEGTVLGAAALGAALDDDDPVRGAVIGAATGVAAEGVRNAYEARTCVYRNPQTGQTYRAQCPR